MQFALARRATFLLAVAETPRRIDELRARFMGRIDLVYTIHRITECG